MLARYATAIRALLGQPTTIGILGYGMEGHSSYAVTRALYPQAEILLLDQNTAITVPNHPLTKASTGDNYLAPIVGCDLVLRSPGIKLARDAYSGRVTSQARIFTHICRERIVGVTGTKGKSTTTSLIHHLLSTTYKTALVGNIGVPPLEALTEDYDYYVCEYSCHQLSDMEVSPRYSLLLNLFPEHLDYYASVEEYYNTKRNIYLHQTATDRHYSIAATGSPGLRLELDTVYAIDEHQVLATRQELVMDGQAIPYATTLAGEHNKLNQLFAAAVCLELGIEAEYIAEGLQTFVGLPHRLETVYEKDGLRYVNDSISTIPQSALAAIASYPDVAILLIGGYDRGIDYDPLVRFLNSATDVEVVLFSVVGERIGMLLDRPYVLKKTFATAVQYALEHRPDKGTVLMSPGASSYDEFTSFVQRGDTYRELISAYFSPQEGSDQ